MKKIAKGIGIGIGILLGLALLFFLFLVVTEFKPKEKEKVAVEQPTSAKTLSVGDETTVMTWNVGYGALGESADFVFDGGSHVMTATKAEVESNILALAEEMQKQNPDILLLQEVDADATRSHGLDERQLFAAQLQGYGQNFAYNYKCPFVPNPFPPLAKVNSGIMSFSKYEMTEGMRISLPCGYSFPSTLACIKRCLLVSRIPIANSEKEVVVINLHLEAYDSGEGKIAQTKLLRSIMDEEKAKGNYVIAAGDFNQSFSGTDLSAYPKLNDKVWQPGVLEETDFDPAWQFVTDNSTPTCRSLDRPLVGNDTSAKAFQYYVIDGFIVSDNIRVVNVETKGLNFVNTDHNPVVLKIQLK